MWLWYVPLHGPKYTSINALNVTHRTLRYLQVIMHVWMNRQGKASAAPLARLQFHPVPHSEGRFFNQCIQKKGKFYFFSSRKYTVYTKDRIFDLYFWTHFLLQSQNPSFSLLKKIFMITVRKISSPPPFFCCCKNVTFSNLQNTM